jgi:putative heme-binding domain-containing protein
MTLKAAATMLPLAVSLIAQQSVEQPAIAGAGPQLYRAHCFVCHGETGESIPGVSFRSGRFRRPSSDEDLSRLILNGIPGTGMPATNLTDGQRKEVVAYIRSLSASTGGAAGDTAVGKSILEGKGGCLACHRVGTRGSYIGPDLSDIGSLRQAAQMERSILGPHEAIEPQNRYIRAVTRDGTVITGLRLNEDTYTVQLIDEKEHLVSLSKSELRELTLLKTSSMPSYQGKLSSAEMAALVSYLRSLKGLQ